MTPYEIVHGRRPNLAGYNINGFKAYTLIKGKQRPKLHKLCGKSIIGYLIGATSANIFIIWLPQLNRSIYAHVVVIDERDRYKPDDTASLSSIELAELETDANTVDLNDEEIDQEITTKYIRSRADQRSIDTLNQPQQIPAQPILINEPAIEPAI